MTEVKCFYWETNSAMKNIYCIYRDHSGNCSLPRISIIPSKEPHTSFYAICKNLKTGVEKK